MQGDPLAMAIYAIGILPIVQRLSIENIKQSCYVPDWGCCPKLPYLQKGMIAYCLWGPSTYCYPKTETVTMIVLLRAFRCTSSSSGWPSWIVWKALLVPSS